MNGIDTFSGKQHVKLTMNSRALKLRICGFITFMGLSVYLAFHILYLSVIYGKYKEALIKSMKFKIYSSDFHRITGSVRMKLFNYFGISVYVHQITGFFVFKESVPKNLSATYTEKYRIFGSGTAEVNQTMNEGDVDLNVSGVLNFADVSALGYVLQGMSMLNLKNPLEYHIFIDATITIFNRKLRVAVPFIKVKPFVYNPLIILKRLYVGKENIMAFDDSDLTPKEKKQIAKVNNVKNIYFLEDLIEHFKGAGSIIKSAISHGYSMLGNQSLILKVLLIFKFYHIHLNMPSLKVFASFYLEKDFIKFSDNSSLSKFNALKALEPKKTVSIDVNMIQLSGIKGTEPDAFTTKAEFNNRFLSVIEIKKNFIDFYEILMKVMKIGIQSKFYKVVDTFPTLVVGIDRTMNKFNSHYDYNNHIAERMGTLAFYFFPPSDEMTERNKKFIGKQDEHQWFDDYDDYEG